MGNVVVKGVLIVRGIDDSAFKNTIRKELMRYLDGEVDRPPVLCGAYVEFLPYPAEEARFVASYEGDDIEQEGLVELTECIRNRKSTVIFCECPLSFIVIQD